MSFNNTKILIANNFNNRLRDILNKAIIKSNNDNIKQLKQKFNLAVNSVPFQILETSWETIYDYRKIIKSIYDRDNDTYNWNIVEDKFNIKSNRNIEKIDVIDIIHKMFNDSTEDDKIAAYADLCYILMEVAKYRKLLRENDML